MGHVGRLVTRQAVHSDPRHAASSGAQRVLVCHVMPATAETCPFKTTATPNVKIFPISIPEGENGQLIGVNVTQNVHGMNY